MSKPWHLQVSRAELQPHIKAAKRLISGTGPRTGRIKQWLRHLSDVEDVPLCGYTLHTNPVEMPMAEWKEIGGFYRPALEVDGGIDIFGSSAERQRAAHMVILGWKPDVVLHESRHHLQWNGKTHLETPGALTSPALESDSKAWSLSLAWLAAPRWFVDNVCAGNVMHMTRAMLGLRRATEPKAG